MLYQHTITIPSSTLIEAPYEEDIPLGPGILSLIRAEFPYGCGELAGVALVRGSHQFWPLTPGEYASWNDGALESAEEYPLDDEPYTVTVRSVNYDALNSHTITLALVITPPPSAQQTGMLSALRAFLGV